MTIRHCPPYTLIPPIHFRKIDMTTKNSGVSADLQHKRCANSSKILFWEHAFIWNKASDLSLVGIFIVCDLLISSYLNWTTFSGSLLSSGEALLLNWFSKIFKFSEGFNKRELSLFKVLTCWLSLWKLLAHMEKILLLFIELNGKIWLQ